MDDEDRESTGGDACDFINRSHPRGNIVYPFINNS